jgi:hypothetical protein
MFTRNYVMVSHEVQNVFILRVVSLIFEFKIPIGLFKVFSILKYIWKLNFIFLKKNLFF